MSKLSNLPNIGKKLEERLISVGITDSKSLKEIGSKGAYIKLKSKEFDTCINVLYALEGAIEGVRWHELKREIKDDLKDYFSSIPKLNG